MARHAVGSLRELLQIPSLDHPEDWHVRLIESELNGGKQSQASIDTLSDRPDASALTISGLDQNTFEYLVKRYGPRFTAFYFWKCPRLQDISPLEELSQLTHVAFYWNQRATRLWNFRKTPMLRGLHFDDFTRLKSLDDLAQAESLRELAFGNAVWSKSQVETLDPLAALSELEALAFNVRRVLDGRIQPLAQLHRLEFLEFPSKLFSTEQLCWLRAHLPGPIASSSLAPLRELDQPLQIKGKMLDVLINGRGKPFLDSRIDSRRVERYVLDFESLVNEFASQPLLEPRP